MKKIFSITLTVFLVVPFAVFAQATPPIDSSLPGSAQYVAENIGASVRDFSGVQNPAAGAAGEAGAAAAAGVKCGSSSGGGAGADAVAGSGLGSASGVANCLLGSVRGGSITSGASCLTGLAGGQNSALLGQFLGIVQNPSVGNIANLITTAFPGITQQITQYGQQALSGILGSLGLGNLGSGALSSITSAITGGATSAALSAGTSALGAVPGLGALAGLVGGLGMKVPVIATEINERQDKDDANRAAAEAAARKTLCDENPAVTALNRAVADRANAQTIAAIAPYVVKNYGNVARAASDNSTTKTINEIRQDQQICSQYRQQIAETILELVQQGADTQGADASQNNCFLDTSKNLHGWKKYLTQSNPANNYVGQYMKAVQIWSRGQINTAREVKNQLDQGYQARGTCLSDPNNPNSARIACTVEDPGGGEDFEATTPPSLLARAGESAAVDSPNQQLINSKLVGETVNPQVAGITNQLLSTLMGFIGLSQGSGGNSSYTGQIGGGADTTSIATARSYLVGVIDGSILVEDQYQRILDGMVRNLNDTKGAFNAVRQCYVTLSTRTVSGLSSADITARIDLASTTIRFVFDPQITARTEEYNDSILLIGELQRLRETAQEAATAEEVNAVSSAIDSLQSSGLVHNDTDVSLLTSDAAASRAALQAATANAQAQLIECQAF